MFRGRLHWILFVVLVFLTSPVRAQFDGTVRVSLFDLAAPTQIRIASDQAPVRLFAADYSEEIAQLDVGDEGLVTLAGDQIHIKIGEIGIFASSIRAESTRDGQTVLGVVEGKAAIEPRYYQGTVRLAPDESDRSMMVVNEIDLEDYVAAVVSTEYGFDDMEGSKAMAVIIRTYTLAIMNKYDAAYDHVDHTLSQVYRGTDRITPTIRDAVNQTRGQILSYDDRLIEAVYFSTSGGHTADNESVWQSEALPYLRGKPDPYGSSAPNARWSVRLPRSGLLSALSSVYGDVTGFVVGDRGDDGRVTTVDLLDSAGGRRTIRANEFRLLVLKTFGAATLRSTYFTARRQGDEYVFDGNGSGHGVGLSQWGAHDLALRNKSYTEILDFYYTDVRLEHLDDFRSRRSEPRVAAQPKEEPRQSSGRIGW